MRALSCLIASTALLLAAAATAEAQAPPAPPPGLENGPAAAPAVPGAEPSAPDAAAPAAAPPPATTHAERLDRLFSDLKREASAEKASEIATRIQAEWLDSGSATVDLLMARAAEAQAKKETAAALDLLDQTIVLAPDFPEGWNRRATVNYTENQYGRSIADVEETLRREPRHFAALAGLASMQEELGRRRDALATYARVLAIYPTLKEAQDAVLRLSDELAGERA